MFEYTNLSGQNLDRVIALTIEATKEEREHADDADTFSMRVIKHAVRGGYSFSVEVAFNYDPEMSVMVEKDADTVAKLLALDEDAISDLVCNFDSDWVETSDCQASGEYIQQGSVPSVSFDQAAELVERWITADGAQSDEEVDEYLEKTSDEDIAREFIMDWGRDTYMSREQLMNAIGYYRAAFVLEVEEFEDADEEEQEVIATPRNSKPESVGEILGSNKVSIHL